MQITDFFLLIYRYLNSQHIQKQKFSDADLTYGSMQMDMSEQLLEIGKYYWIYLLGRNFKVFPFCCCFHLHCINWSTCMTEFVLCRGITRTDNFFSVTEIFVLFCHIIPELAGNCKLKWKS